MQFLLPLLTLASAFGLAVSTPVIARQEAARFGVVTVSPSTVRWNESIIVTYNSTRALAQPLTLDVYIQGTRANGFVLPYTQLQRVNDYPADAHSLAFETQLPVLSTSPTNGYEADVSYAVWAFITFPNPDSDGQSINLGGVEGGVQVLVD